MAENKRTTIMNKCIDDFEDFEDDLKDFIDDIEQCLNGIRDSMKVTGLDDLSNIETAYDMLDELTDSLY